MLLAYYDDAVDAKGLHHMVESLLEKYALSDAAIAVSEVPKQDWEANWRQFFSPIWATSRIVIHPSWIPVEVDSEQIAIVIDPKMAFGTGEHESTQLCLQMLEEMVRPGWRCLDLGTGSGILAIAAASLGAGSVRAVDPDPNAVHNARENVLRNGISESVVEVAAGGIDAADGELFDLIVGNIQSSVLRPILAPIAGCLRDRGRAIFSGLLHEEREPFCEAVEASGLRVVEVRARGNWVSACAEGCP